MVKSNTSISVDSKLLEEARGVGLKLSTFVEQKLKEYLNHSEENEALRKQEMKNKLNEVKKLVSKGGFDEAAVFKAIRKVRYLGYTRDTLEQEIEFWGLVLEELKESTPAPPKEQGEQ